MKMATPDAALKGVQIVAGALEREVFPLVQAHSPADPREWLLWGYFQRVLPICSSLALLVQPSFFQLTLAANRTLLECFVDVIHLAHNEPTDIVERIETWEASARLKAAEAGLSYLTRTKQQASPFFGLYSGYIQKEGPGIRVARQRLWPPDGRHPDRWSRRNLGDDCRGADRLENQGLEDFYETQYRQMNWNIHGSGFAGIRGLNVHGIDMIYTYSQAKSAEFALRATTIILQELGLLGALQKRFEQLASEFADTTWVGG
jgi:uncharacterized protein DUF5677